MSDETPAPVPEARVLEKRRLSVVWVIPLVAALIGAWLTWKSVSEKGLHHHLPHRRRHREAGKTKIRYRELRGGRRRDAGPERRPHARGREGPTGPRPGPLSY
ncbi:MAG: hypothetical protein R3F43_17670 [bacterium]